MSSEVTCEKCEALRNELRVATEAAKRWRQESEELDKALRRAQLEKAEESPSMEPTEEDPPHGHTAARFRGFRVSGDSEGYEPLD